MKKFLTLFASALLFAACAKQVSPVADGSDTITINVAAASQSKAVIDGDGAGACITRCILEVYMKDAAGDYQLYSTQTATDAAGTALFPFTVKLIKDQDFKAVAWADAGEAFYTFENGIATAVSTTAGNSDSLDAFCGKADFTADAALFASGLTIIAQRPLAQINIIATDISENAAFAPVAVKLAYNAPASYNVITGEVSDPADFSIEGEPYNLNGTAKATLAMAYVFTPSAEEQTMSAFTFDATVVNPIETRSFTNVPLQNNWRTNIIGDLLTTAANITVEIDPIWEGETDIELWTGQITPITAAEDGIFYVTKASELAWIAQQVNSNNTFAGKTVMLSNDIDLNNYPWTPIGNLVSYPSVTFEGTFDGQDHVISNLNATDITPNYACAGFFGSTLGTVKNVIFKNVKVYSTHYAGAVVGYSSSSNSVVENCHVDGGTITSAIEWLGSEYDNGDKVGGIFGFSGEGAPITGCTVKNVTISGYRHIGGIAGYATGSISGCDVQDVVILQDNTNGYKSFEAISDTFHEIAGYGPSQSGNTFSNVTIKSITSISSQEELNSAVASASAGAEFFLAPGNYTVPNIHQNITISGTDGVKFNCAGSGSIASIPNGATFENCEFTFGNTNYHGFQHAGTINMNGCTLNGLFFSYGDMNFNGCHFVQETTEYNMWAYGRNLTYTDCVFDSCGKFINVYNEGSTPYDVTCTGCRFNTSTVNKPAINIKATSGINALHHNTIITDCSANFTIEASTSDTKVVGSALWQVDDINQGVESTNTVTVDGVLVYDAK